MLGGPQNLEEPGEGWMSTRLTVPGTFVPGLTEPETLPSTHAETLGQGLATGEGAWHKHSRQMIGRRTWDRAAEQDCGSIEVSPHEMGL